MKPAVYVLCTLVSLICAVLLLRGYGRGGHRLLLWSGICFSGLTLANALMFLDLVILPASIDLYPARQITSACSVLILLFGMIWEGQ